MKKRHEVLFNQLESYRSEILGVMDTVSEEDAEKIPAGSIGRGILTNRNGNAYNRASPGADDFP